MICNGLISHYLGSVLFKGKYISYKSICIWNIIRVNCNISLTWTCAHLGRIPHTPSLQWGRTVRLSYNLPMYMLFPLQNPKERTTEWNNIHAWLISQKFNIWISPTAGTNQHRNIAKWWFTLSRTLDTLQKSHGNATYSHIYCR